MSKKSKQEYLATIRKRYLSSSKEEKQKFLDEVCGICGYNRKYVIRVINNKEKEKKHKKIGRKKKYIHPEIITVIKSIWISTNLICSKRLKFALPLWLPFYEEELLDIVSNKNNYSAQDLVEFVIKSVKTFTNGTEQTDDITCVSLKYCKN